MRNHILTAKSYAQLCISSIKNNLEYIENSNSWRESNFPLSIAFYFISFLLCKNYGHRNKKSR